MMYLTITEHLSPDHQRDVQIAVSNIPTSLPLIVVSDNSTYRKIVFAQCTMTGVKMDEKVKLYMIYTTIIFTFLQ